MIVELGPLVEDLGFEVVFDSVVVVVTTSDEVDEVDVEVEVPVVTTVNRLVVLTVGVVGG